MFRTFRSLQITFDRLRKAAGTIRHVVIQQAIPKDEKKSSEIDKLLSYLNEYVSAMNGSTRCELICITVNCSRSVREHVRGLELEEDHKDYVTKLKKCLFSCTELIEQAKIRILLLVSI